MPITVTNLTGGISTGAVSTTYVTASMNPSTGVILAAVSQEDSTGGTTPVPVIQAFGLTWTQVRTVTLIDRGAVVYRLTVFRSSGGAPTTGASTISFTSGVQQVVWSFDEFSGCDTVSPVVQSTFFGTTHGVAAGTTGVYSMSLASLASTANVTYGAFQLASSGVTQPTVGTGFSLLFTTFYSPDSFNTAEILTEWSSAGTTAVSAVVHTGPNPVTAGIALELANGINTFNIVSSISASASMSATLSQFAQPLIASLQARARVTAFAQLTKVLSETIFASATYESNAEHRPFSQEV